MGRIDVSVVNGTALVCRSNEARILFVSFGVLKATSMSYFIHINPSRHIKMLSETSRRYGSSARNHFYWRTFESFDTTV